MRITEYKSLHHRMGSILETDWELIAQRLSVPYRSGYTRAQFCLMDKDAQKAEKEKSGGAIWGESIDGYRNKISVPLRCALSLDYDHAPRDIVEKVVNVLDGISYVIYSTINSTDENPRIRVIIPTDRLMNADEHDAVGRLLCGRIGIEGADKSMLQNARMMLYPAVLADQNFIYKCNKANFLDVDEWLGKYADWRDISQRPLLEDEKEKIVKAKRNIKTAKETGIPLTAGDPRDKKGIVGAFCTAYSIPEAIKTFLPDVYEEGENSRFTFIQGSSKNGVAVFDGQLCYSFHSTDPAGMQILNSYDLVRIHKFGGRDKDRVYTDISRAPSNVAMASFAKADKRVLAEMQKKATEKLQTSVTREDTDLAIRLGFHILPTTDMGTARRLAAYVGDTVKYDKDKGVWYVYRDGKWVKESDATFLYEKIERVGDMTVAAWIAENKDVDENYINYVGTNRNQKAVINCLQALIGVNSNDFDADDENINLKDGYMSLADGNWVDHEPSQMCRLQAGAQINGDIDPECMEFIESVIPDEETRNYVQRLCGYMVGRNNEQKLVIFYGERGNNGKSTFANLVQAAMGDYAKTGKIDSLLTAKGDGDPERANPSLAMLQNVRCVLMHENDYNRSLRSAEVKRITSNNPVVARFMRENFVEFIPKFTCVIDVNHAPSLQDAGDEAMRKRVRIIPFTAHFSGSNVKRDYEKKVYSQGWLNMFMMWALDGRQQYLERGLDDYDGSNLATSNLPAQVKGAMAQYFEDSDDVGEFVTACIDVTNDDRDFTTVRELYGTYERWVVGTPRGDKSFSMQLKKRLSDLGIEQARRRDENRVLDRGYVGIKCL